jgi:hypothetical protein
MTLSLPRFCYEVAVKSVKIAATTKGAVVSILGGAAVYLGMEIGEKVLIYIPLAVFVLVLVGSLIHGAYQTYLGPAKELEKLLRSCSRAVSNRCAARWLVRPLTKYGRETYRPVRP